jgi:hypothetical protein
MQIICRKTEKAKEKRIHKEKGFPLKKLVFYATFCKQSDLWIQWMVGCLVHSFISKVIAILKLKKLSRKRKKCNEVFFANPSCTFLFWNIAQEKRNESLVEKIVTVCLRNIWMAFYCVLISP